MQSIFKLIRGRFTPSENGLFYEIFLYPYEKDFCLNDSQSTSLGCDTLSTAIFVKA